ncbi:MAG: TolC family protein [Chitinophagaceae bacterium]
MNNLDWMDNRLSVIVLFWTTCIFQFISGQQARAQRTWTLDSCIQYAYVHNVSVARSRLQEQSSENTLHQSRNNRFPTLGFSSSLASQFGRSIDPTTNSYTNTQIMYSSMGFQSGVTLFNWFSIKNTVRLNEKNVEVARLETERLKNDLKLNIAAACLQVLLAEKQLEISRRQIELTARQLELTGKQVDFGKKPESDLLQMVTQLASDSTVYYTQISNVQKSKSQMKTLLGIDQHETFEVDTMEGGEKDFPLLREPEAVYEDALLVQPRQREDRAKLEALNLQKKIAKASLYPTISGSANISSSYSNKFTDAYGQVSPYFRQLFNINLYQYVGVSVSVPIYSNRKAYYNYKDIGIQVKIQQLQADGNNQQLKQDIYDAYNTARSNLSVYLNSKRTLVTTEKGYVFAQKRFEIGKSTLSDYLMALNTLYQARINQSNAYYNYIFSVKILSYYGNNK